MQVEFEVVIKLLKLVETHVLVIIMEPGTKIMDPEIKRSRLNMKASLTHYEHSTIFGTQHNSSYHPRLFFTNIWWPKGILS